MSVERFIGVDLAWKPGGPGRPPNETGVAVLDAAGRILDAGWTRGPEETAAWITTAAGRDSAVVLVDASLIVTNAGGQRPCETEVGRGYGRWKVSASRTRPRPGPATVSAPAPGRVL